MKRETKIGMFRIIEDDLGVYFYPQLGNVDTGVWYLLYPSAVEELKSWFK